MDFHHKIINGLEFKSGTGAQERMFSFADENGHKVYIATDFRYEKDGKVKLTKAYRSFKDWDEFFDAYYPRNMNDWFLYEVIREGTPCRIYWDLDWSLDKWSEKQVLKEFTGWVKKFFGLKKDDFVTVSGSRKKKGSFHVISPSYFVSSNTKLKKWVKKAITDSGSEIIKGSVDWKIYTKNRLMRICYSRKMEDDG